MSALEQLAEIKPFCPVHHWRMAVDSAGPQGVPIYRCNYEQCQVRYHAEEGYFESGRPAGNRNFLSQIESISCKRSRDHHPRIVSYAKDSSGGHSEEWRQWQCHAYGCDFSHRQLLTTQPFSKPRKETRTSERTLTPWSNFTLSKR
jgi:hypothetical protein